MSIVTNFVKIIYDHANSGKGHSWRILNSALFNAVGLAIESHLEFSEGDFKDIYEGFKGVHWFRECPGGVKGDSFYVLACKAGNASAAKSFEKYANRRPLLYVGERLYVGRCVYLFGDNSYMVATTDAEFHSQQVSTCRWYVTSLSDGAVGLCQYAGPGYWNTGKPKKRRTINRAELDSINLIIRKKLKENAKEIKQAAEGGDDAAAGTPATASPA